MELAELTEAPDARTGVDETKSTYQQSHDAHICLHSKILSKKICVPLQKSI